MNNHNTEPTITSLLTHHLEEAVPAGADLWPTVSARLAERDSTNEQQSQQHTGWFRHHHLQAVSAIAGVLVGVIGLYLWMIGPDSVDAQEILNRAHAAQALSTNSGIHSFTLTLNIDECSNMGEFHAKTRRWYQEPGRWRVESRWTGTAPYEGGTRTVVSDGNNEWMQQGDSVTVSQATPYPETDELTPWGRDRSGLTDILDQVSVLYTSPELQGEETIAGRPAYVIDLGLPNHFSNSAPELNNGRHVIWVDKETFFLIKSVKFSPTDGTVVGMMEVTDIQYNIPIDPGVFSFTPLPGVQVHDLRYGHYLPKPNWLRLTSLAEARQKASFSIFIPTVIPAGLVPESPTMDQEPPGFIRVYYRAEDGSTGLCVLNGPAGSGLAADPRKKGETIKLRGDIEGHFLNNQPQFGGPILWWEEDGSYVALSGIEMGKTDLVKMAATMSPTADI